VHHRPADSLDVPRFTGVRTFMRLPHTQDLADADVAVVGVPTDSAVFYRSGARFGPEAIRSASNLLRVHNPVLDVNVADTLSMVDYGDAPTVPGYHVETLERVVPFLSEVYEQRVVPLVLGGDHSLVLAELRAAASAHGPVAVVHFDAHPDVLDEYLGQAHFHNTVFRRAAEEGLVDTRRSIQIGMRGSAHGPGNLEAGRELGYEVVTWQDLSAMEPAELGAMARERVGSSPVVVSFDIDFLAPAFAPGTGTPEVGGPTTWQALTYLRALGPLRYCSFDCVEVAPPFDPAGVTALAAAGICFEMLSLLALSDPVRRDRQAAAPRQSVPTGAT
jgi:agmatinase